MKLIPKPHEIYGRDGIRRADKVKVKQLMENTFYLQRCHINAVPSVAIEDWRTKWPYLFTQEVFCLHFQPLTNVPVLRTLELASSVVVLQD